MSEPTREVAIITFKKILLELQIAYKDFFLFGSRATNSFKKDSDWDFFIILDKDTNLSVKRELKARLRMKFHEVFPFSSIDIVLKNLAEFNFEKDKLNTLSHEVVKCGFSV